MEIIKLFLKFAVVGLSGVGVNLAIYSLLIYFQLNYLLAAVISFLVAVSNNFYWNFIWTFKGRGKDKTVGRKYLDFFLVSLANFLVNMAALKILHEGFAVHEILAQALAIGLASMLNFLGNYLITFREKGEM